MEAPSEPDFSAGQVLGELAVHRETMRRVLRDSPQSFGEILSALTEALEGPRAETDPGCEENEDLVFEGWREV